MTGIENIERFNGFSLSISGLCIVFFSLLLISIYITLLPRILEALHTILPESDHPDVLAAQASKAPVSSAGEDLKQAAAAAVAYHQATAGGR